MCTVTIVPLDDSGFRLVCNRDERRSRAGALAPSWRRAGRGMARFPIDPDGGGTWIGVNDAGIAMALLNRTPVAPGSRAPLGEPTSSRGVIIPALLGCRALDEVLDAVPSVTGLARFEPFSLVIADANRVGVATNEGGTLSMKTIALSRPVLFTSSSLGDEMVEGPRRRLFEAMLQNHRAGWPLGQFRFHRTQWTARPDISVLMERADARTVSRTVVDVDSHEACLHYEALNPHDHLARRAA